MSLPLGAFVDVLGGTLVGVSPDRQIERIAPLDEAGPDDLSFLSHARYQSQMVASAAACVIVSPALQAVAGERGGCLVTPDPYAYFARATQLWRQRHAPPVPEGIHPSAVVDASAVVDPTAWVGPLCVVGPRARIGPRTQLVARVSLGERCEVGARCILHPGVVVGADGFGFAPDHGRWVKIEQLGAVRIGDDVEIGANTCIDRGALGDTVIGDGVKLDNLIQVGHNVQIGAHSAMAGCVGIAGSARIGAHCTVGGGGIVLGHLELADHVHVSAASVVTRSIRQPGQYTGMFPIDENARWEKNAATLRQLNGLRERVKALEQRLQAQTNNNNG